MQSVIERLASLPSEVRAEAVEMLDPHEREALPFNWRAFARPDQIAPDGDWDIWLALAGRGWGKTETGARWVKERVEAGAREIALVAETQKDLEEVMVARLVSIYPPDQAPKVKFKPVKIEWPNGAVARGYNGTEPNQLRGPEFDTAWVDELAKYRYARETWDMLQFCMRSAALEPKQLVTTTPRPIELIKALAGGQEGKVVITRGKTQDNASNLSKSFLARIERRYSGTRLGRQEIEAEILGDLPGALWSQSVIDAYRVTDAPTLARTVVSIDPAVTDTETSDEHGIIVAGIAEDDDNAGYLLEDVSMSGSPMEWAQAAIAAAKRYDADGVVVEVNQGGDMVAHTLRTIAPNLNIIEVRATRGKHVRAEPIASLYQQGRIRHVGAYPELESQMTQMTMAGFQGDGSPDRLDALVWAFTELFPDMTEEISSAPSAAQARRAGGWMGR